jgi:AcrR family transcriptional regulator
MPSPTAERAPRWERRKDSRPSELLRAALDLFTERGFAATRLDDVAKMAGVSKGTLYLYFPSKEDLFKACVRETIVPMIEDFKTRILTQNLPAQAMLRAFFHEWWSSFGATKLAGLVKLIVAEANNFPEVARFFNDEVIALNIAVLEGIIERGIQQGAFRPVNVSAHAHLWMAPMVLRAIWNQSVGFVCQPEGAASPEEMIDLHLDQILRGLAR